MPEATKLTVSTFIIEVPDVPTLDACRGWYEKLGLTRAPLDNPGESYWFDLGSETLLGIHTGTQATAGCSLWLLAPDVDEAHSQLTQAGIQFETTPRTEPYGRVARLKDPAGFQVNLITRP